jgi:predicted regulator of Ras-like GTPase activity (Roadblock/LC7/MglB family)
MTAIVTSSMAERIVDDILSSISGILSAGVIDKSGNIIANKSSESFEKQFKGVSNLEQNRYSGTLAVAALSIANEVKDAFGEPKALITIYRDCKLVLLPVPSYDILIGLALESSANVDNDTFTKEMESLVASILKP